MLNFLFKNTSISKAFNIKATKISPCHRKTTISGEFKRAKPPGWVNLFVFFFLFLFYWSRKMYHVKLNNLHLWSNILHSPYHVFLVNTPQRLVSKTEISTIKARLITLLLNDCRLLLFQIVKLYNDLTFSKADHYCNNLPSIQPEKC